MNVPVDAYENSTTGGEGRLIRNLDLKIGDVIVITNGREDKWKLSEDGSHHEVDVNGVSGHFVDIGDSTPKQKLIAGSMVGSFNGGVTFFPIGLYSVITVLEGGNNPQLTLWCADSDQGNNSGNIIARVLKLGNSN